MIMSISSILEEGNSGSGVLTTLAGAARRLCAGYVAGRLESGVDLLRSLSDRELNDLGLSRPEIDGAIRGVRTRARALSFE
jgi:hypothetical protein